MSLKVSGEGGLGGWYTQPILTGQFNLSEGDIRQDEFLRQRRAELAARADALAAAIGVLDEKIEHYAQTAD